MKESSSTAWKRKLMRQPVFWMLLTLKFGKRTETMKYWKRKSRVYGVDGSKIKRRVDWKWKKELTNPGRSDMITLALEKQGFSKSKKIGLGEKNSWQQRELMITYKSCCWRQQQRTLKTEQYVKPWRFFEEQQRLWFEPWSSRGHSEQKPDSKNGLKISQADFWSGIKT